MNDIKTFISVHQYDVLANLLSLIDLLALADEDLYNHISFKLTCIHIDGKIIFYVK